MLADFCMQVQEIVIGSGGFQATGSEGRNSNHVFPNHGFQISVHHYSSVSIGMI